MKIRHTNEATKIELQMTPMIDIVFQLLVFFIMTFKIVSMEGDFNIKMPVAAPSEGAPDPDEQVLPMLLRLTADQAGRLTSIELDERTFANFDELHDEIMRRYMTDAGPSSAAAKAEVQLDCDYNLRYEYVIAAITALSGHKQDDTIIKLIEKINFAPPRGAP